MVLDILGIEQIRRNRCRLTASVDCIGTSSWSR
jgi:hypothetical protein